VEIQSIGTANYVPTETDVLRAGARRVRESQKRDSIIVLSLSISSFVLATGTCSMSVDNDREEKEMDPLFRKRDRYVSYFGVTGV
jgi:hypothetical protein